MRAQPGSPTTSTLPDIILLAQGPLRLAVAPALGGALAGFWSEEAPGQGGPQRCDWLRPAGAGALAAGRILDMASFPLVPFCNRLREGRAEFEGRKIRLLPNHPALASAHPLHGMGWQRPWTVEASGEDRATLALSLPAGGGWPWAFSARQEIRLADGALQMRLSVTNQDPSAAMPAGIGFHPYFPRRPGTRLQADCAAMWATDAEVMPTVPETGEVANALRAGMDLDERALDNNFTGWRRVARIDWPEDASGPRRHLLLEAEPELDYFVLYNPAGADHFCAEPVSQCTDWLNLVGRYGRGSLGGARLEPGQTLEAGCRLTPVWGG